MGEYRAQLAKANSQYSSLNSRNSVNKSIMSLESLISNKMVGSVSSSAASSNVVSNNGSLAYRNTLVSQNAQSILTSRNNSIVSDSQFNGQLASGQSIHSLKSANGTASNNQFSQSIQSLKNSSLVSGAASTVKLNNPSSNTLAGAQSIQSLRNPAQPTGISVSTQISAASSLQSLKNPSATSAVQGISVSTQISGAPSIPSLKNASGSLAGSESMASIKTGTNSAASMKSNTGSAPLVSAHSVQSIKSASGGSNPSTPTPTNDQSLKNPSASSVGSANSMGSGKNAANLTAAQSNPSLGSHNLSSEIIEQPIETVSSAPVVMSSNVASGMSEETNNVSLELSSNEGSIGVVNEPSVHPNETSIHIEIVPAGQPSPASLSSSSFPNEDQGSSAAPASAPVVTATTMNTDGVYTLETLSSSSSVQIKDN